MTDSQTFLAIIGSAALVALLVLIVIEMWEGRSKRRDRAKVDIRDAYDAGFTEGYEEALARVYSFTKAGNIYTDWQAFRQEVDSLDC